MSAVGDNALGTPRAVVRHGRMNRASSIAFPARATTGDRADREDRPVRPLNVSIPTKSSANRCRTADSYRLTREFASGSNRPRKALFPLRQAADSIFVNRFRQRLLQQYRDLRLYESVICLRAHLTKAAARQ